MEKKMSGTLYLVATPIGNLMDITYRAVETLKEVDLIAAEDTRHSIKLLNHFEIKTPMTSYHEHNKIEKARVLVEKLLDGVNIALVTDAGTPGISDPGEELVRQALDAGIIVSPIPGPAACICALIMSGLPTRRFCFEAFLPTDKKQLASVLEELKKETRTIVLHEAPHRLGKTLKLLSEYLGEDRRISICKEITKKHEKVLRFTLSEAIEFYQENEPKGEYVLVIDGIAAEKLKEEKESEYAQMSIKEHYEMYIGKGLSDKDAMKQVAKDRNISKRDVYSEVKV